MAIDVEQYYRQYGPMVHRRCMRLLGNEEAAVDAMQDTFVRLMENAGRLNADAPSSLLYRMATNVCLNKLRTKKRKPENVSSDLVARIADARVPEQRLEAAGVLGWLFGRTKESTRTIAVLHLLDGMTLQEVANEVGMSVSGVRKRLAPLRDQLAELGKE